MSNKQEFPIKPILLDLPSNNPNKILTNHPYFNYKAIKTNDYTHKTSLPSISIKRPIINNQNILSPLIRGDPFNNEFNSISSTFTKVNTLEERLSEVEIHDSFKFSEFQSNYPYEEPIGIPLKSVELYNQYDITRNKSKFPTNFSTIIKNKLMEDIKFMCSVFKTQIAFIKTLDHVKKQLFDYLSGDLNRLCEAFLPGGDSLKFNDFLHIFKKLGIEADIDDVKLLFWRVGVEKIGLDRDSFKKYFTPINKLPEKPKGNKGLNEKELIGKVLKMNLNFEYSLEMLRKEIKAKNIGLKDIFDKISLNEETITQIHIKEFLSDNSLEIKDIDAEALYLLYDPNRIGLTFKMFYQEILPKI